MYIFWILIAAILIVAISVLIIPLLAKSRSSGIVTGDRQAHSLARRKLEELEIDRSEGNLDETQYHAARTELERLILDELDNGNPEPEMVQGTGNRSAIITILILLPLMALTVYHQIGRPNIIMNLANMEKMADSKEAMPSIDEMVTQLALRLQSQPDDAEGWTMLARSYMVMKKYQEAVQAWERVYALDGENVEVLIHYADALSMASGRNMKGRPEQLIEKALQLQPQNPTALWLAGIAAYQNNAYESAIGFWHRLLPLLGNDTQSIREVHQFIAQAQDKLGITGTVAIPLPQSGSLTVDVSLNPELVGTVNPEDTVFVIAREIDGMPLPVAVVRRQVRDLPLHVVLDDSMAMMPSRKLSSFSMVEISTRVSKSGQPTLQSGDLVAKSQQVKVGQSQPVTLVIDTRQP